MSASLHIVYLVLFGCALAVAEEEADLWDSWWKYEPGTSGPSLWGAGYNVKWKRCSIGKRQSPIDIMPNDLLYDSNLKHVTVSKHKVGGVLRNTGHDLRVDIDRSSMKPIMLSDGPLSYTYHIYKIVIHFGSTNKQGSEHRVNSKTFPAEVQIYAFNDELYPNETVASEEGNFGIAVISLLISVNNSASSNVGRIFEEASLVQYKGSSKPLSRFSVHGLLPETLNYITYEGSLTQPGCYETATWIIMNKPVYVTNQQLIALRNTMSTIEDSISPEPLQNNYRPTQNLNRRALRTNINFPEQKSSSCDIKREKAYAANPQVITPK